MSTVDLLWHCFLHFVGLDKANAAIHCAPVRYSPITFRLAEHIHEMSPESYGYRDHTNILLLEDVLHDSGAYDEDKGR